jgi:hypothetical protein
MKNRIVLPLLLVVVGLYGSRTAEGHETIGPPNDLTFLWQAPCFLLSNPQESALQFLPIGDERDSFPPPTGLS